MSSDNADSCEWISHYGVLFLDGASCRLFEDKPVDNVLMAGS